MNKKKIIISIVVGIVIIIGVLAVTHLYLLRSGWYKEQVSCGSSGFTSGWNPSYADTRFDNTSHEEFSSVGSTFWTFSGACVKHRVNTTVKEGSFDIIVHDITETGFFPESITDAEEVYHETITESGSYLLDFSDLPLNRLYRVGVYENQGCSFLVEVMSEDTVCRWMYIHDKYLTQLPFIKEKYDPENVRLGNFPSLDYNNSPEDIQKRIEEMEREKMEDEKNGKFVS